MVVGTTATYNYVTAEELKASGAMAEATTLAGHVIYGRVTDVRSEAVELTIRPAILGADPERMEIPWSDLVVIDELGAV